MCCVKEIGFSFRLQARDSICSCLLTEKTFSCQFSWEKISFRDSSFCLPLFTLVADREGVLLPVILNWSWKGFRFDRFDFWFSG